jgi:hypothetical protein
MLSPFRLVHEAHLDYPWIPALEASADGPYLLRMTGDHAPAIRL